MEAIAPQRRLAGRYVLESQIGAGGMATVWLARDEVLARTVAIKLLREELARDPTFLGRFRREAVAAARLNHPGILRVFDTGVDDGLCYIVMEFFDAQTLQEVLDGKGRPDPSVAVSLILPILSALEVAHASGVIHRDLKPGNVLVANGSAGSEGRQVKVADFGLAKAAFDPTDLTATGAILGTVRYLSPEQVQGGELTPASDLYAVGAILYELLTGRPPFEADGPVATAMVRLTKDPIPPRDLVGGIPRGLQQAVMRALARRPEDRFASAAAMRTALEPFAEPATASMAALSLAPSVPGSSEERPAAATPVPQSHSWFRSWMLVPLIVVLVAAAAIVSGVALGKLTLGGPLGVRPAEPSPSSAPAAAAHVLSIVSVRDVDPFGDGSENPDLLPLVEDGDPATAWTTEHYRTVDFGSLKPGLGLWIDLGRPARLDHVAIDSPLPGWTFELEAGSAPGTVGDPLAAESGATSFTMGSSGRIVVDLRSVTERGVLVWVTRLAPAGHGGQYQASVGGVTVSGTVP
jgi:serine/threonine protein kinase